MLQSKLRSYESVDAYFDYLIDKVGYPPIHKYFEKDSVESDGIQLHVDIFVYDKSAPTVVFVPGTAIYALCLAEFLYKLGSQGFNIVAFDPRGHGRSQGDRGDYTIEEIMRDTHQVTSYAINRFNDNVSLLGSSQGGIVSFYLAAKDTRLKGVTCQCFADLTWSESTKLTRFPAMSKALKPLLLKYGHMMPNTQIPVSTYLDFEKISVKHFGNLQNFMDADPLVIHSISFRAVKSLASTKIPTPIEDIKVPVMVFQGDSDTIFPVEYTQAIYDKLTCKKRIEIFKGFNHAIIAEDPDAILPPIVEWLKEIHDDHRVNPMLALKDQELEGQVFLDTDDAIAIDHIWLSYKKLMRSHEFKVFYEYPAEPGWKKRIKVKSNGFVSSLDMGSRFVDIESELNNPEAGIKPHRAEAFKSFLETIVKVPGAVFKVLDLILIHTYDDNGKHIFVAIIENLRDKAVLRKRPELLTKPKELYNILVKNHREARQPRSEKVG